MDAPRDALVDGGTDRPDRTGRVGETTLLHLDRVGRVGFMLGAAIIVAGGLIAAVAGPLGLAKGSWLAAYLVLVAGVAQCCLAVQDRVLGAPDAPGRRLHLILIGWNTGNSLVVVGTLAVAPVVVDAGGILLVAVLIAAITATRHHSPRARATAVLFRLTLALLVVSVPIGLVLAHVRAAA